MIYLYLSGLLFSLTFTIKPELFFRLMEKVERLWGGSFWLEMCVYIPLMDRYGRIFMYDDTWEQIEAEIEAQHRKRLRP